MLQIKNTSNSPVTADETIIYEIRSLFPDFDERLQDLIAGMSGCSPFLYGLVKKEINWIKNALTSTKNPEAEIISEVLQSSDVTKSLRIAKGRIALWTALQDLSGNWQLEDVSKCLSEFADFSVKVALRTAIESIIAERKFSKLKNFNDAEQIGIFILAMGKLGALELNYSSDIDLVCFFDDEKLAEKDFFETRKAAIAVIKGMTKILGRVNKRMTT